MFLSCLCLFKPLIATVTAFHVSFFSTEKQFWRTCVPYVSWLSLLWCTNFGERALHVLWSKSIEVMKSAFVTLYLLSQVLSQGLCPINWLLVFSWDWAVFFQYTDPDTYVPQDSVTPSYCVTSKELSYRNFIFCTFLVEKSNSRTC